VFIKSTILDLTTFTATSVDVERVFSKGRLVLSHVRNRLSVQSTRASMCLGDWSRGGLVKNNDVMTVARLPEVSGSEDELDDDWDGISE
jgi:hAT family C-terminal dimerisation region